MPDYQVYFDTVEGEKMYPVNIGDQELLNDVIDEMLAELQERGHWIKGVSTGELKVIWMSQSLELDLSRPLAEQGVQPNDALRILVESYEGGAGSLRRDRLEQEWGLLGRLAAVNPGLVSVEDRAATAAEDTFTIRLTNSPGITRAAHTDLALRREHTVRLTFPRVFPDVPIVCHVDEGLFHPNVRPENGFVCLWERTSKQDTVIQAIARTQAIAAYRMINLGTAHVMNPAAASWYTDFGRPRSLLPIDGPELQVFEVSNGVAVWLEPHRRRPIRRLSH